MEFAEGGQGPPDDLRRRSLSLSGCDGDEPGKIKLAAGVATPSSCLQQEE